MSCRESSSRRRSGRDTDKTVLSCPARRCELALSRRPTHVCGFAIVVGVENVARQTEVGDLDDELVGDEHVSGRQVAMYTLTTATNTPLTATTLWYGMAWYGMVNVDLYSAIITKVSNALNTLVSGEKPGFQALSKGLIVLLCVRGGRSARSSRPWGRAQRMLGVRQWLADVGGPPSVAVWLT